MRTVYRLSIVGIVLVMAGAAIPAHAQGEDKAAAEQLFMQGKGLMDRGELDEACERFEASQKLDPALGTLLNLALCREKQGKVASAWALYREAAVQARREGQAKRESVARERAEALQGDLPELVIEVSEQVPGLVVERDGTPVDAAVFGVAVYVDPGAHRVTARAPGYREFSAEIETAKGKEARVEIPVLERDAQRESTGERGLAGLGDAGKDGGEASQDGRTRRLVGLGAGGAGIAAMAVGLGFGWSAKATWDDAFSSELCDRESLTCSPAGQARTDSARSRALASNLLIGAGVALAAAGVVLYVTASSKAEKAGISVVPMASPSEIGMTVQGGF